MSNLAELLRAEHDRHAARIMKLRRTAAAEQRRVDAKVIDLLRETNADLYLKLASQAAGSLVAEKAQRSKRAKSGTSQGIPENAVLEADEEQGEWPR